MECQWFYLGVLLMPEIMHEGERPPVAPGKLPYDHENVGVT